MHTTMNGFTGPLSAPERNHFFYGLMGVAQFEKDVCYVNTKRSLINRDRRPRRRVRAERGCRRRQLVVCPALPSTSGDGSSDGRTPSILTSDRRRREGHERRSIMMSRFARPTARRTPIRPVLVADCDTPGNCAPHGARGVIPVRQVQDPRLCRQTACRISHRRI